MFTTQDNQQDEDNNQNEVKAWNNSQTIFDISLITTNKDNYTNNLGPAPTDINADQIDLILNSSHGHHTANFGDLFQNNLNPFFMDKEDKENKIELIEKAPIVDQNRSLKRNKRFRGWRNHNKGLINNANQDEGIKPFLYKGKLENDSTLGHSSYRPKRRKKKN